MRTADIIPAMYTAIVTGTSTGIGFATAVSLARAGHDVFATMRDPVRSPELASLALQDHGRRQGGGDRLAGDVGERAAAAVQPGEGVAVVTRMGRGADRGDPRGVGRRARASRHRVRRCRWRWRRRCRRRGR